MRFALPPLILASFAPALPAQVSFETPDADLEALPAVPDGFEVSQFAAEPLVRNPAAMAFDTRGRLFVGMGPQWRGPTPETPKDEVIILEDRDNDGAADARKVFATGFNSVQAIAWNGRELWVANSPDLTVVRDVDGDDVADEYIKIFTDLGNIEHSLHGLNWGPDGCLYMSKGNSKGISLDGPAPEEPGRVAPKAFRELWGYPGPEGAPDLPPPSPVFTPETYRATYQDPRDDWGQTGGILRYDPAGRALTIHSRGYRNPWDIAFDASFDWLGTDNDQTGGDRIFMPFQNAHFGWGHPWSPTWPGEGHLPTAPNSGPIIEGSYTGIVFADTAHFPASHRGVWFVGDWMRKAVYLYRPDWRGALNVPQDDRYEAFVTGGPSLFRPTDLAMGPDGALWVLGWGRDYGGAFRDGEQINEGRVYRITAKGRPPVEWRRPATPHAEWGFDELLADLGSWIPAWQTDAQNELLRRGDPSVGPLGAALREPATVAQETWAAWTLARLGRDVDPAGNENLLIQLVRAGRIPAPQQVLHANPRVRLAAVEAIAVHRQPHAALLDVLRSETDPVVYHAAWRTVMDRSDDAAQRALASHPNPGVRRAGVLIRMESLAMTEPEAAALLGDEDGPVRRLAAHWLSKVKGIGPAEAERGAVPDAYALARNIRARSGRNYVNGTVREGEPTYIDRPYAIDRFPEFLNGASMIRTSNDDDGSAGEAFLTFDAPLDVTVYLAHDERVGHKPGWMGAFGDSDSVITSTDPNCVFRLFAKDFPAGTIALGGNTADGKPGGKGQYFVILVPRPPAPRPEPSTLEAALAALPEADPARGEALFHAEGGAACATCHTVGGRGFALGPDLTGAGDRFDARYLLESLLAPGEVITEGFSLLTVAMKDGTAHSGILRESSSLQLTLAQPGGSLARLDRGQIATEETQPVSLMPPFGHLLSPGQLADVTAFLLAERSAPAAGFHLRQHHDRAEVFLDGQPIGTYQFRHEEVLRPAWINLRTPGGRQVTRNYPPRVPEDIDPGYSGERDGIIHPHMHPGVWFGFGDIDGHDFWRNTARVEPLELERVEASHDRLSFAVLNRFLTTDGTGEVCRQRVLHTLTRCPGGWQLDLEAEFFNAGRAFEFGDQEESGLGVRVASPLRVQGGGGRITNSLGQTDGAETWGHQADWWDYSGTVDGEACGLFVMPHATNARRCWGHTRDYGVMVANPFPRQPKERREPYVTTKVEKGEVYRLGYSVVVHEGAVDPKAIAERLGGGE